MGTWTEYFITRTGERYQEGSWGDMSDIDTFDILGIYCEDIPGNAADIDGPGNAADQETPVIVRPR